MGFNIYDIRHSEPGFSREDRLVWLKLRLMEAYEKKDEAEIFYYTRLLNMYEKMMDKNDPLIDFIKNKDRNRQEDEK